MYLEDFCEDIVNKAQKGLGISDNDICEKAKISHKALNDAKSGIFDELTIRKIAHILDLDEEALVISGKKAWQPNPVEVKGLKQYTTVFHGNMKVNAYLVWDADSGEAAIFDTGADAKEIINDIKKKQFQPKFLFLTHAHRDHVGDVNGMKKAFPDIQIYIHKSELIPLATGITENNHYKIGKLEIKTHKTDGHSEGGMSYEVRGLERPLVIVGDAIFAGSIGGVPPNAYKHALKTIKDHILSMVETTVICPGHGPMTTVKEEIKHNPFLSS